MHYVLRVQGHLDPSWSDRLGGLRIEPQEAGTTLLSGSVPDQAALQGLLLQIVRLGLVLLELSTSEANGAEAAADRRPGSSLDAESSGQCQCDCWMAAKFDTYLAEYQHGLCFSFVRGVSFTGQSKNFPSEKAVDGERQIIIKNYAIQSSHVQ
jgi:hypothetical protein